jgi:hypothetical protein
MAKPVASEDGGRTEPVRHDRPVREVAHIPIPFLDESEGGWCSDKPRRLPKTGGSWLDYEA